MSRRTANIFICDQCGKEGEPVEDDMYPESFRVIYTPAPMHGDVATYDFCSRECLVAKVTSWKSYPRKSSFGWFLT